MLKFDFERVFAALIDGFVRSSYHWSFLRVMVSALALEA
jgi:hypothetical protein